MKFTSYNHVISLLWKTRNIDSMFSVSPPCLRGKKTRFSKKNYVSYV